MYMKVKTEVDAWKLTNRIFPGAYELDPESKNSAGYPIYRSTEPESNAYICGLNDRLELNYDDGHSENIWIEDRMPRKPEGADVAIGMYRERTVFGEVMVRDVKEYTYLMVQGLVAKTLDDGRQGIEITLADGEVASFGNENVAYVRFN